MVKTDKQVISGYHRPVCVTCHCELRPETNGVGILDMFSPQDTLEPKPCELFDADLWKCPKCGIEVVGGFGFGPVSAHYLPDFNKHIEFYKKQNLLIENLG